MQQQSAGFVEALFDFSFTHFITSKFVKIIYGAVLLLNALLWLGIAVGIGLDAGFLAFVGGLIVAAIGFAFFVIVWRIVLELVVVVFRIAEHSREIASQGRAQAAAAASSASSIPGV